MSYIATFGCAISIISHIYANGVKLMLFTSRVGTNLVLKLSNFIDLINAKCCCKLSVSLIDTTAVTISCKNHGIMHICCDKQIGFTSTTEILTSLTQCCDHGLCINETLSEIISSVVALKFFSHCIKIDILMNGVQFIVSPDRTNVLRENLLRITVLPAIADHSRNGQGFLQRNLIDSILELYIIKVLDIYHIITMKLGSNIHGLRIGGTSYQLIVSGNLLLVTLFISLCRQGINVPNIYMGSTNATIRNFLCLRHNSVNPSHIICNEFRCTPRMCFNIFRKQRRNVARAGLYKAANPVML